MRISKFKLSYKKSVPLFLLLLILFNPLNSFSQKGILSGQISGNDNNIIPYASIFEASKGIGTVSNIEGNYSIELPYGKYKLEFSSIGYKKKQLNILVNKDTLNLNIRLEHENYIIPEIMVGVKEDPAYEMIRQAIKSRERNLLRTGTFEAKVYSKGIYRLEDISDSIMGQSLFDSTNTREDALGIIYLSEAESKFCLKYPDKIREEIVSSKVSGDSKGFTFNFSSFININLYRNLVFIPFDRSIRGFVSPISTTAMMYYKYKLVGSFLDGDYMVHKIELIPRRKIDRVFHGYIYLVEGLWCIHSTDLIITEEAEIDFIDSIRISQEFVTADDSIWTLQTQNYNFDFSINFFGLEAEFNGHYLTIFNEYNRNPEFPPDFFSGELLKIDVESNKKDSMYWEKNRPVPLSLEEEENYLEFDSVEQRITSKVYLDSIDRITNEFKFWNYLKGGYSFRDRYKERHFSISTPLTGVNYNTVRGFNIILPVNFRQKLENQKYFNQKIDLSYGFSNKLTDFNSHTEFMYDRNKYSKIKMDFGISHVQFDGSEPISATLNNIYSLFLEQNYMKLYRMKYVEIGHSSEIFNGFMLSGNLEYSDREPLTNTTTFSFTDVEDRQITANTPWIQEGKNSDFIKHQALIISVGVNYTYDQKYASLPYKTRLGSMYPPIGITYTKAISGIFGSDANFDLIKIYSNYSKNFGLFGESRIKVEYNQFLNTKKVYFSDYIHFKGNKTIFFSESNNSFHMLDYYNLSTNDKSFEVHYQHHFNGFIINKIPWVRKSKLRIIAGTHYLFENNANQYAELNIGVKNIFKFGRIDFVAGFRNHEITPGITIGFGL